MIHLEFNDPQELRFVRIPEAPKPSKPDFCRGNWLPKDAHIGVDVASKPDTTVAIKYTWDANGELRVQKISYGEKQTVIRSDEPLVAQHSGERAGDAEGWISHDGGAICPVPAGTDIEFRQHENQPHRISGPMSEPQYLGWSVIIAYRIVKA